MLQDGAMEEPQARVAPPPLVVPGPREQREQVKTLVDGATFMEPGEVFYLLALAWWERWRQFVGYEEGEDAALSTGRSSILASLTTVRSRVKEKPARSATRQVQ